MNGGFIFGFVFGVEGAGGVGWGFCFWIMRGRSGHGLESGWRDFGARCMGGMWVVVVKVCEAEVSV